MPNPNTTIEFNVEDRRARAAFNRLKREVDALERAFGTTRREARAVGEAIEKLERFPIDAPSVQLKNLSNSFFEFQAAIRDTFLPVLATGAQALTSLLDTVTDGVKTFNDFFDIVDERHNARRNASESAREFAVRFAEINAAAKSGAAYAYPLENIANLNQRSVFFQYTNQRIAQGLSFDAARKQAEAFFNPITATPSAGSPDAAYGNFTSRLSKDFQDAEEKGRSLLDVMQQIANIAFATDLDNRIPDPIVRDAAIDERTANAARGQQTLTDIRQAAGEQGRQFLNTVRRREARDIQKSINARARSYRQFANLVSNTFINLATGSAESFESVATAFIQQSLRIVLRAVIENQILKRLDDTLTASKIANLKKVSIAQQAGLSALPGVGTLGGVGNLASALSGGGVALGVSALLFPREIKALAGGISDTISGLLSNVASAPDNAFGAQQVYLKIGENETREITDLQDELRQDNRV